jgi:hypothetical protein
MSERSTGFSLLGFGVLLMLLTVIQITLVFTNIIKPIPLFSDSSGNSPLSSLTQQAGSSTASGQQLPALPSFMSSQTLNQSLNTMSDFFLMSFIGGFGYKLANLGVLMLRPVVVKLKSKDGEIKTAPASPNG